MTIENLNILELFAGCGGLTDGFEKDGHYNLLAAIEWAKEPFETLKNRLNKKWHLSKIDSRIIRFDIQRTKELLFGWSNDVEYGSHIGLEQLIDNECVNLVIGGPPCQAYSIAGRIRDANGMRDDYRNYLFESYIKVLKHFKPSFFVFENVPGLLTAKPGSRYIKDIISESFNKAGYFIPDPLKSSLIDMSQFSLPQIRQRLIILGVSKKLVKSKVHAQHILKSFYEDFLNKKKGKIVSVREAIGDLPKLYPTSQIIKVNGRKTSHTLPDPVFNLSDHFPRYHSLRDIEIFRNLAQDLKSGTNEFRSTDALKKLYTSVTGKNSNIHKYHVLDPDKPSCLIPAHLYKDGLRHIHPDPDQARTITVREAARLQGFPDDFIFCGSMTANYQMIGNAVPPLFSNKLADAIFSFINSYCCMKNGVLTIKN